MVDLLGSTQIAYALPPVPPAKPSLQELLADKARTLYDLVGECVREIQGRLTLSQQLLLSMEAEARAIRSELMAYDIADPPRRVELEHRLTSLLRDQRLEQVAAFRETAALTHEKRQWTKSHQDLQQRLRLLIPPS